MTQTTIVLVQGQDAVGASPTVGKQRVGSKLITTVTGITGRSAREIGCPHQHIMGRVVMLHVAIKVAAVAGDALTVGDDTSSAPLQGTIVGIMTG